jgi:iron complex outermembrane receptor protein
MQMMYRLLSGVAAITLAIPVAAQAQTTASDGEVASSANTPSSSVDQDDDIVVLGFGQSRQVQSVTAAERSRSCPA